MVLLPHFPGINLEGSNLMLDLDPPMKVVESPCPVRWKNFMICIGYRSAVIMPTLPGIAKRRNAIMIWLILS